MVARGAPPIAGADVRAARVVGFYVVDNALYDYMMSGAGDWRLEANLEQTAQVVGQALENPALHLHEAFREAGAKVHLPEGSPPKGSWRTWLVEMDGCSRVNTVLTIRAMHDAFLREQDAWIPSGDFWPFTKGATRFLQPDDLVRMDYIPC